MRLLLDITAVTIAKNTCNLHISYNRFRTEQGHCGVCRRKWRLTDTDLCPCGETQTMSHVVESCPLTKLNGSLSGLHSVDEDAVLWLTSYGSWNAYEKKLQTMQQQQQYTDWVNRTLGERTFTAAALSIWNSLHSWFMTHYCQKVSLANDKRLLTNCSTCGLEQVSLK